MTLQEHANDCGADEGLMWSMHNSALQQIADQTPLAMIGTAELEALSQVISRIIDERESYINTLPF